MIENGRLAAILRLRLIKSIQVGGEQGFFSSVGSDCGQALGCDRVEIGRDIVEAPVGFAGNGEQSSASHVSEMLGRLNLRFLDDFLDLANAERPLE